MEHVLLSLTILSLDSEATLLSTALDVQLAFVIVLKKDLA